MADALESISARPVGGVNPFAAQSQGFEQGEARRSRGQKGPRGAFAFSAAQQGGSSERQAGPEGRQAGPVQGVSDDLTLSPEAQQQLRELKLRDAEVRAHERAHMAAGGGHVLGGAHYVYQKGPDGRQYAIGGHVNIDTASVPGDAEASAQKARQIRRAALAPGEPSAQDRKVASQAAALEAEAHRDKRAEEKKEQEARGVDAAAGPAAVAGLQTGSVEGLAEGSEKAQNSRRLLDAGMAGQPAVAAAMQAGQEHSLLAARHRAAGAYADMALRGTMPTALAPGGTGISLQI